MEKIKKKFSIDELSKKLNLDSSIISFWEKEFELQVKRYKSGKRYYTEEDLENFNKIQALVKSVKNQFLGAHKTTIPKEIDQNSTKLDHNLIELRSKLERLLQLL